VPCAESGMITFRRVSPFRAWWARMISRPVSSPHAPAGGWSVARAVPVIAQLTPGLQTLRERLEAGETEVFDDAFRARWTAFVASVGEFKAARERDAAAGA